MFEKTNRPYKDASAKDTIEKIKGILNGVGLIPTVTFSANPYPEIYSLRLKLGPEYGEFGTNGKGRTEEYSLASGYAEFLERMQNGLYGIYSRTIVNSIRERHGFYYTPEEKYLTEEEFVALPDPIIDDVIRYSRERKTKFISEYFERLKDNDIPGVVAVPFYDTKNKREIFLPLNLLMLTVGSNGMAAGNTVPEAIFQAVCELTERWGAAEIFYKQLTPPTVPREFLKQFKKEYAIIERIEENGKYQVTVKDFSAGKKLPTLGLIITNLEAKKYRLNVGSDTSLQVALSRTLTEVYQGVTNNEKFDELMLDMLDKKQDFFEKDDEDSKNLRYLEFGRFTQNARGNFPPSLFGNKPSYPFDPDVFTTHESYKKEVQAVIANLHENGINVYIRDVSYMGFPSVLVYVPEISAMGRKNAPLPTKSDRFHIIELDKLEPLLFDIENLSNSELRNIAETLGNFSPGVTFFGLLNVSLKSGTPLKNMTISFFVTLVWHKLSEFKKARDSFLKFMENRKDKGKNEYYNVVETFFELKAGGCDEKELPGKLMKKYPEAVVKEVLNDLSNPDDIFKNMQFPRCPDCTNCGLFDYCLTRTQMKVSHKLYPLMKENKIDQEELSWTIGIEKE